MFSNLREFVFSYSRHPGLWRVLGRVRPGFANVALPAKTVPKRAKTRAFLDRWFCFAIISARDLVFRPFWDPELAIV